MAHRRKKRRTQQPGQSQNATAKGITKTNPADRTPKSMVIRMGASEVGPSVTQLVKDVRTVMEPHTAIRLKERRSNKLKDFTTMAGPLGVTHFLLFSRSESGNTNMRLAITPRGPTLNFRVEKYSLCKDIVKSQRRPRSGAGNTEHLTPPLLVMNNFTTPNADAAGSNPGSSTDKPAAIPKHLENLSTTVFQSLFPAISPQTTPLSSIRRVLLLNRITTPSSKDDGTYTLQLRHYAISSRRIVHLSRGLRRLKAVEKHALSQHTRPSRSQHASAPAGTGTDAGAGAAPTAQRKGKDHSKLPDLSRLPDVADYLLDPGYVSASESDAAGAGGGGGSGADTDAEVEVLEAPAARKVLTKKQFREQQLEYRRLQAAQLAQQRREHGEHGEPGDADEHSDISNSDISDAEEAAASTTASNANPLHPPPHTHTHTQRNVQKRAIRLHELGPRLTLRLVKVEEGLCEGKILWHESVTKTPAEQAELESRWAGRRAEREERRAVQRENLARKRAAASRGKGREEGEGGDGEDQEGEEGGELSDEEWDEYLEDLDMDMDASEAEPGADEEEDEEDEMEVDGDEEAELEDE